MGSVCATIQLQESDIQEIEAETGCKLCFMLSSSLTNLLFYNLYLTFDIVKTSIYKNIHMSKSIDIELAITSLESWTVRITTQS